MENHDMLPNEAERYPIVRIENGEVLASSRDIAAFFDREHRDVLKAIDNLIAQEPDLALRNFSQGSYQLQNTGSQNHREFMMDRDGFTLLVMGFTGAKALKWKLRYIEAFNAMERELTARRGVDPMAVLNDPSAMRGLLLTYSEKVLALEERVADMAPAVDALDRIAKADGSLCITDSAKALQVRPKDLFSYLREHGWIYKRPGSDHYLGYQTKVATGLLEHKVTTVLRADGSEKVTEQVRITPKGFAALAKLFPPAAAEAA